VKTKPIKKACMRGPSWPSASGPLKKRPKGAGPSMFNFFFVVILPCAFLEEQIASNTSLIAANNAFLALPRFRQLEDVGKLC